MEGCQGLWEAGLRAWGSPRERAAVSPGSCTSLAAGTGLGGGQASRQPAALGNPVRGEARPQGPLANG